MVTPIGTEMFNGFRSKYPEFEVITPQRKQSFTVRTMTVNEEENLKGSLLTPLTVPEHLAQVLWTCICKKPDYIKTYDDFINNVTLRDRDALIYGLYVATYKDIQNFTITCRECDKQTKVKVNMDKSASFDVWPDDKGDIMKYHEKIELEITQGVDCYLKVPTMADEIEISRQAMKMTEKMASLATDSLMIEKFVIHGTAENPTPDEIIKEKNNIVTGYTTLPAKDRKTIDAKYRDVYDTKRMTVMTEFKCECGNVQKVPIDITRQFFLALY